ncbi:alpha-1,3-mannosyl-glycoprotein 2-beta-N-acetylglucosaminyltransferase-like isoform X2 [Octopus vulgaris]|uniref:Alpha-1,3-mannosyl-glycoprotein 2-beta-N-acetylglucosaminyltransferase-like isoform X2 n=2 Tax=Octopus TaxID=6643 RepID=A0AA36BF50_OCTVU|nr:alpha-1,3-mannosyl-glycoprotein 2-beta-N-acetylglucosaminyltransferase-like [Octopus sinensis]XP_036364781.1 alpha-1,3-mannosyl-glycoprotein 2-beta-N-acetylglucosaminyltransferase-like [Octopus sinensis]CAI9732939.1 alpha-1,3-mannosyl-glycoprotein 2-beta-N-acetylglucosaminyltransferase-like isoform X2 [Octopus vulgaris]
MRHKHVVGVVITVFLSWNLLTYYVLVSRQHGKMDSPETIRDRLKKIEEDIHQQMNENEKLLRQLQRYRKTSGRKGQLSHGNGSKVNLNNIFEKHIRDFPTTSPEETVLPVLLIACDRTQVSRSLDQLIKYRKDPHKFPIVVSQDCGHVKTSMTIDRYKDKVTHIKHPDLSDINLPWPQTKFQGYYKIARHYRWAINQVLVKLNFSAVIIVEDDLDISPDFFEYFAATYPILRADPLLWCVSAWNDNGKDGMVSNDANLLYRTDFFPGLGWMMERRTWLELEPKWPKTFWDDWMRHPEQRKNRACIRPEICRTSTFGKQGVSKGQFFDKHLKFIKLNQQFVPFTKKDISYLMQDKYDVDFIKRVYSCMTVTATDVVNGIGKDKKCLRVQYNTKEEFKTFAKQLGIMDDLKAGVPRAGYRGVVSIIHKSRRVYLTPPATWSGYNPNWN